ncbi:FMN-binding negative transcriptional regulator, partial [Mammaliicoccus sciuri]
AYISSTWYEKEDVPTWDYQSIHAYGKGHLLSESELIDDLTILLNKYEIIDKMVLLGIIYQIKQKTS